MPILQKPPGQSWVQRAQDTHPAFIVDGEEQDAILISKYQNIVINNRAYSLPFKDPANAVNFDNARTYCRNKGTGWHLQTNALWAAIALWCKKNGTQPHGNSNYGQDVNFPYEKAIPSMARDGSGRVQRCATGSGPDTFYHDYNSATGIADMNGNVMEWCGGLRLQGGEIQIIPYGNAMKDIYSGEQDIQGPSSGLWQALTPEGTFANPGEDGTLKWDYTGAPATGTGFHLIAGNLVNQQTNDTPYGNDKFGNIKAANGVTIPQILKGLALFPDGILADYDGIGQFYFRNNGERLPYRGGSWFYGALAGVFTLNLSYPRSNVNTNLGFRAAFYGTP